MKNKLDIIMALYKKSSKVIEGPALAGFFADAKAQLPEVANIVFQYESKQVLPTKVLEMLKQHLSEAYAKEFLSEADKPLQESTPSKAWTVKLYDKNGAVCNYCERKIKGGKFVWNRGPIVKGVDSHIAAERWANQKLSENADSEYAEIMNIERGEVMRISRTNGNARALKPSKQPFAKSMKPSTQKLWMKAGNTKVNFSNG